MLLPQVPVAARIESTIICGAGYIYGYGLGPNPQVTVGGVAAQVTAFVANAYGVAAPPFPLESVAYTIPPGTNGSAVDVAVSTSAGSTTATGALTYLPSIQKFPLTGSTLAQCTYDPYTDLYYFTDTSQLQVFSRTQGKWLSPITIPAPSGPNGIDVFDGKLGNLRTRISLPIALSPNYDALVEDGRDNVLIAITGTGNGIAIVDLTSVSEPPPLPYDENVGSRKHHLAELGDTSSREPRARWNPHKHSRRPAMQPRTVPHVTRTIVPYPQ